MVAYNIYVCTVWSEEMTEEDLFTIKRAHVVFCCLPLQFVAVVCMYMYTHIHIRDGRKYSISEEL